MERAKEEDLDKLEREKLALEQQIAEEDKKNRAEMRKWERKVKDSEIRLETINKEVKEKEQENRISKLKIKEMRRLIKHNQLKPIVNNGQLALPNMEQDLELASQVQLHESQINKDPAIFLTNVALNEEDHMQ